MPDTRLAIAVDIQAMIAHHQPGEDSTTCTTCPDEIYPCDALLMAEQAAERLARKIASYPEGAR
jgi:hypothetical protein